MRKTTFPYRLYLVISQESCSNKNLVKVAEEAILGGVDIIQLREKNISNELFLEKALQLQECLSKYNVPLIINDNLNVAIASDAFGIHVGNNDISPKEIREQWTDCQSLGYSIEYLEQLENESTSLSDCLGISPVFQTHTKTDTVTEWGLNGIKTIRSKTEKPLIAIGNMNISNAAEVIKAGADCIAVVSAICGSDNPQKSAYEIRNEIEKSL